MTATVDWDDGTSTTVTLAEDSDTTLSHTYDEAGDYTVSDSGTSTPINSGDVCTFIPFSYEADFEQPVIGTNVVPLPGDADAAGTWSESSGPSGSTTQFASGSSGTTATVSEPGTYEFDLTDADGNDVISVFITVLAYVALGDSYSAGDGAVADPPAATPSDYLPGGSSLAPSSSGNADCLQSVHAYPELVDTEQAKDSGGIPVPAGTANPAFSFAACTAAVISNIFGGQTTGAGAVPPQATALADEPTASVGLVTLTIGGNDAGFGKVMGYCALRITLLQSCEAHSKALVEEALNGGPGQQPLEERLEDLYNEIEHVKNTDGQSPLAPGAQIVVLGYPKFFPTGQSSACPTGVPTLGFQPSDMAWLDYVIYQVDNVIEAAADAAGVTYYDTYNAFDGNELCQANPYLNDVTVDHSLAYTLDELPIQSFHPTIAGQAALAAFAEGNGVSEAPSVPRFTSTPPSKTNLFLGEPLRVESGDVFTATGNPPPTFAVSSGALPEGLTLDPVSGLISGTPVKAGTYTFRVTASNSAGSVTSATFTFRVLNSLF